MSDTEKPTGYKAFNSTGRDDSTTEIIKPQLSAETKRRNALYIGIVCALVVGLLFYSFLRSGLNPFEQDKGHGGLGARGPVDISRPPSDDQ